MDKEYLLSDKSLRRDSAKGVRAYRREKGVECFNEVAKDFNEHRDSLGRVLG